MDDGRARDRRGGKRRLLALALLALAAAVLAWALLRLAPPQFQQREALTAFLDRQGRWGPLAFMGLQAAQVVLAPIPGHLLGIAGGAVFGLWRGALYTAAGVGAGSAILLALARSAGRPLVERLAPPAAMTAIDRWTLRRGPLFFFAFFLLPFTPDDLACLAVGLSSLPLAPMLGLIVLARLPGHILAAWLGATATGISWQIWAAGVLAAGLLFVLTWRRRGSVEAWMLARLERTDRHGRGLPPSPPNTGGPTS